MSYSVATFKDELVRRLNDEMLRQSDIILSGNLTDYSLYKDTTGVLRGMQLAVSICDDVISEMNRS